MRTVSMIAARCMTYMRRDLVPGEPFDCSPAYAIIAERQGRAVPRERAEAHVRAELATRRSYRRRELTPEV